MFQNQLINVQQVANILCASVSGVWEKAKSQPDFPKPFKLSAKQTRWKLSEVNAYIEMKQATALQ
ncbi:helix-turn-helix transcriptional regulator [Duganella qianjiadongensis]|uniref:AlpA family phage regulatory protein n=1 Tax=Duganella qianjiadongensis TaxID=2692176 RepID=A0ABW9VRT6_9BURK|nr:AlpA family phage regulatory protein [Duganella qianjiadongensis]MYM41805.1 AlpA family phage regulatory protein [Duganella qianjiadongensis]